MGEKRTAVMRGGVRIVGTGRALPPYRITNEQMAGLVNTSDEWIVSRTGIHTRRMARPVEQLQKKRAFSGIPPQTALAIEAARRALDDGGISPEQVMLVLCATATPAYGMPSTACLVEEALGLPAGIPAFDLNAACSGFIYGLAVAGRMMEGMSREGYTLVIGAEVCSEILDFTDRNTCVLFGDGAGAVLLGQSQSQCLFHLGAEGDRAPLFCGGFGQRDGDERYLRMDGRKVFRFATEKILEEIKLMEAEVNLTKETVDWVVCHQANERILDYAARKSQIPSEKFYRNMDRYGNTCAASIPIALSEMKDLGKLKAGQKLLLVAFGAGLTWGSCLLTC